LSARGIAIDTGLDRAEEFPRFVAFWLERDPASDERLIVHALLDGPSLSGAFTFVATKRSAVVMDVAATLFFRRAVERLGIAPLTSMYWYSETNRTVADDWRGEVHDSDGLAVWNGRGEQLWRPLNNPPRVVTSSFVDDSPRGFGLLQRDRALAHYDDDQARYDLRPSAWVEPLGSWGAGMVQLVEIPTADETFDNVVVYWTPKEPTRPGASYELRYRLHWTADLPFVSELARVVSTRQGRSGYPGKRERGKGRRFAIDFEGEALKAIKKNAKVELVTNASSGARIEGALALPTPTPGRWRGVFDVHALGSEPVEMRAFLRTKNETLSETWLYQLHSQAP
jgi:periplasmic glucans biosynthesis protein